MHPKIKEFAEQARTSVPAGLDTAAWIERYNEIFAELIIEHCSSMCGSQADRKNLRNAFGLPIESDVKYPAPEAYWSVTSQYDREYNLPKIEK